MRIHADEQDEVYTLYWEPMQTALGDNLTEYIRHFLMRDGSIIKQGDVYYALKESVTTTNAIDYLKELKIYSTYYQRLIYPNFETELEVQKYFYRLNKLVVTTAYPLLLNFYSNFADKKITKDEFVIILRILENYLIRRFVCNVPTNQLNKIFPTVYPQIETMHPTNMVEGFKSVLQNKGYPKDNEFFLRFKETKFYGAGDTLNKYFAEHNSWTRTDIEQRADVLAKKALEIWSYFGQDNSIPTDIKNVTGTIPTSLKILGQRFEVETWRDVLEQTLNTVADLEPEKFEVIAQTFPHYVGNDKNKFRAIRDLKNGYFIEVNLSAQSIQKLCHQAMETIELSSEDWNIEVK